MKSTNALKAAGLVLIAVVLGMLTVQGSYALWNKSVASNAGNVQAADFKINLTDSVSSQSTDMTLPDGTAATLSLTSTPAGVLLPGQNSYAGVQVGNVTNASGDFTVRATTAVPAVYGNSGPALAPYLSIKAVPATSLSQCNETVLYASATPSGPAMKDIAKGSAGVFCFQVSLSANMPANLSGKTASIAIPITVNQL